MPGCKYGTVHWETLSFRARIILLANCSRLVNLPKTFSLPLVTGGLKLIGKQNSKVQKKKTNLRKIIAMIFYAGIICQLGGCCIAHY